MHLLEVVEFRELKSKKLHSPKDVIEFRSTDLAWVIREVKEDSQEKLVNEDLNFLIFQFLSKNDN